MGLYNADGSIAVTVVDGTQLVGRQAPDGSINVVVDDTEGYGVNHRSGALRVNSNNGDSVLDYSGAYYINHFLGSHIPSTVEPPEEVDETPVTIYEADPALTSTDAGNVTTTFRVVAPITGAGRDQARITIKPGATTDLTITGLGFGKHNGDLASTTGPIIDAKFGGVTGFVAATTEQVSDWFDISSLDLQVDDNIVVTYTTGTSGHASLSYNNAQSPDVATWYQNGSYWDLQEMSGLGFVPLTSINYGIVKVETRNIGDGGDPSGEWPDSTNTGHLNAPGYPGSLTVHDGSPLVEGATYNFIDFDGATVDVDDVTFFGCRFRSNWTEGWNVKLNNAGTTTFKFCTIEPTSATIPNEAWPSAGTGVNGIYGGDVPAYMIPFTDSYQYGILQTAGGLLIEDSNIWGFGNSIVLFSTEQKTIRRCWIHDSSHEGPAVEYHNDGPGHLDGSGCSNVLIEDCTIASLGNTNAIAFQTGTYSNIIVRRNYLSGFGVCVDMCHGTEGNSGLVFEDNVLATDINWTYGPFYTNFTDNFSEVGSSWSGNTLSVYTGSEPGPLSTFSYTSADDGKFLHPDGTLSAVDWTV